MTDDERAETAAARILGVFQDARISETADMLRRAALEADPPMHITTDDRIGEADLAKLLGIAPGTMANRRREGKAPPHYTFAAAGHRVTYRMTDVAAWIEKTRKAA